jgi:probable phosphoglycerate mutase
LLRTRETAAAFGVEPIIDDRWIELDYGDYDGVPLGEIDSEIWRKAGEGRSTA